MIVCKFGGTSVADAGAIRRAGDIIREKVPRQPVVVVSALAGVTNALLSVAEQSSTGQLIKALSGVEDLRARHIRECDALLDGDAAEIIAQVNSHFDELAALANALNTLGHATPRSLDAIAAIGERCASLMAVAAFRRMGIDAVHVDARTVMKTDSAFTRAEPETDAIAAAAREHIIPIVRTRRIPVMGGFVGSTDEGITTTLGRGGGDYSAALVGAAIQAEAIEIWTDVDGMLTSDPRVVPDARLIEEIRFDEASELAYFGAKVLHPATIAPAVKLGIPVFIFNSRRPQGKGTRITFDAPRRAVTAIAGKTGVTILRIRSTRMLLAHGFLREIFDAFARNRTAVDVVATSEVSVSVTVDDLSHLDDLLHDLSALGDVSTERNRGIVVLVGADLGSSSPSMARALTALGDIRVHMLSLSATRTNLTLLVDGDSVQEAMRRLHGAFFSAGAA
jgi:aspartate kinase